MRLQLLLKDRGITQDRHSVAYHFIIVFFTELIIVVFVKKITQDRHSSRIKNIFFCRIDVARSTELPSYDLWITFLNLFGRKKRAFAPLCFLF